MGKMADLFDENHMKEQYKWLEDQLKNIPGKLFAYYRILAALLQKKAGLNERIRIAYRKDDRKTLLEISQKELKEMENLSEELRLLRQEIWMKEYKPFGYEILDIRLGGVGIRARSEAARLQAYAEGKLEHIEELEETLVTGASGKGGAASMQFVGRNCFRRKYGRRLIYGEKSKSGIFCFSGSVNPPVIRGWRFLL